MWAVYSYSPPQAFVSGLAVPSALLAGVLFLQPRDQRLEVLGDGAGVHLARAGELFHGFGPGPARARGQHGLELLPGLLAAEHRAFMQRPLVARCFAQRAVELELDDERQEIARVRGV